VTWERKILRKIYGPRYASDYWRVKMNSEIYNQFKAPNIVTVINVRRYCNGLGDF
jgi:hypothetical protein